MMRIEKKRSKFSRLTSPSFSAVHMFLVLLVGYFLGQYDKYTPNHSHVRGNYNNNKLVVSTGSFQELELVPVRSTSHVDDQGRPITKQQLMDPFVLPRLAGISVATLLPGQVVSKHEHESMHEFFYILHGRATFSVEKPADAAAGSTSADPQVVVHHHQVSQGSFVHCAPHEKHEIIGPSDPNEDPLKMLVVGITLY